MRRKKILKQVNLKNPDKNLSWQNNILEDYKGKRNKKQKNKKQKTKVRMFLKNISIW